MAKVYGGSLRDVHTSGFDIIIDEKAIIAIKRKLERIQGKSLSVKMQRATLAAADLLVPIIKAATPVGPKGNLRRYTKARQAKQRFGNYLAPTLGALVGPTSPHRHLVIRGTKERPSIGTRPSSPWRRMPDDHVVRAGTFKTGRMKANPYVDRAARGFERKAADIIKREWFGDWGKAA